MKIWLGLVILTCVGVGTVMVVNKAARETGKYQIGDVLSIYVTSPAPEGFQLFTVMEKQSGQYQLGLGQYPEISNIGWVSITELDHDTTVTKVGHVEIA